MAIVSQKPFYGSIEVYLEPYALELNCRTVAYRTLPRSVAAYSLGNAVAGFLVDVAPVFERTLQHRL